MDKQTEIEIRRIAADEVRKQLGSSSQDDEALAGAFLDLEKKIADAETDVNDLKRHAGVLHEMLFDKDIEVEVIPVPPKVEGKQIVKHPTVPEHFKESPKIKEKVASAELEWVITQEGDLEKQQTQVWMYGVHTLQVWQDGKKYMAQVNDEEPEELWKQKELERVQKRIEKMPQE